MDHHEKMHPEHKHKANVERMISEHESNAENQLIKSNYKAYRRKYPIIAIRLEACECTSISNESEQSKVDWNHINDISRKHWKCTSEHSGHNHFLLHPFVQKISIEGTVHDKNLQCHDGDVQRMIFESEQDLLNYIMNLPKEHSITSQMDDSISLVSRNQYSYIDLQMREQFHAVIDSTAVPIAESIQIELTITATQDYQSQMDHEQEIEGFNELQLKTRKIIEECASRNDILCIGERITSLEKNGMNFESRLVAVNHNRHMKNNIIKHLETQKQLSSQCRVMLLQVMLSHILLHGSITTIEWRMEESSKRITDALNIVQFYNELPSLLQMLNFSFRYSYRLQNPSCCYLMQYQVGSLYSQLIHYLGEIIGASVFEISPYDIYSKLYHGEKGLANFSNQLFQIANESSPAIIFMNHIESFFPDDESEKDQYLIHEMLKILKQIKSWKNEDGNFKAVLIGTSSNLSTMDSFIRKRFDEEITLDMPTLSVRSKIIQYVLGKLLPTTCQEWVDELTEKTHGYTMSDILNMIQKVSIKAFKRYSLGDDSYGGISIEYKDFLEHTSNKKPISLHHSASIALPQRPNVSWDDVGGLISVKNRLEELIVWPIKYSKVFSRMNIRPPSGLLLYGPPGVGKTLIAKAICTTAKTNFISVHIPDLIRAEIGESEKSLAQVFRRAKLAAPCVIFFDEIQAMFGDRTTVSKSQQKLISQFILELDSLEYRDHKNTENQNTAGNSSSEPSSTVLVIAATNVPDRIDPTLLRSKRLEYCIYVGLPDEDARRCIFEKQFSKLKVSPAVWGKMEELIHQTNEFSGADLVNICQLAGLNAIIRGDTESIKVEDFDSSLAKVQPGTTKNYIEYLENWKPNFLV